MTYNVFQYKRMCMGMIAVICAAVALSPALAEQPDDNFYQPLAPVEGIAGEPSYGDETFDPPHQQVMLGPWAGELKVGPEMRAGNIHLRGTRFYGLTLTKANFAGCDLNGVRFYQCDLAKASFKGAYLTGASIEECNITDADFADATVNGLRGGGSLSERQFKSTRSYKTKSFYRCQISNDMVGVGDGNFVEGEPATYDLRGASLDDAILSGDLRQCDFTDTWIGGSRFMGVRITAKQLASTASFKRRTITRTYLDLRIEDKLLDMSGMEIADTTLFCRESDVSLKDAIIERSNLYFPNKYRLYSTNSYKQGKLIEIHWQQKDMSTGWDFSRQNLTGSRFTECDLARASFEDAVITDVIFCICKGLTVEQIKSTWNYKNGRMTGIVLPKDIADALQKEKEVEK